MVNMTGDVVRVGGVSVRVILCQNQPFDSCRFASKLRLIAVNESESKCAKLKLMELVRVENEPNLWLWYYSKAFSDFPKINQLWEKIQIIKISMEKKQKQARGQKKYYNNQEHYIIDL